MISFFPAPYQDEILYSILARYHLRSGNTSYFTTNEDLYNYEAVIRVVALSGGYNIDKACELLSKNNKMIASFSRALLENLNVNQTKEEFDRELDNAITKIYNASI